MSALEGMDVGKKPQSRFRAIWAGNSSVPRTQIVMGSEERSRVSDDTSQPSKHLTLQGEAWP